jgi:hypothetical protein
VREAAAMAKEMVAESRATVSMANEKVRESVTELTERVNKLSGMISKVSRAAMRVASIYATTVGGLQAGARIFEIGRKKKSGSARDLDLPERDERPRLRRRR